MNIEAKENSVIAPQPLTKNPKIIDRPNSQKLRMKENQACTITWNHWLCMPRSEALFVLTIIFHVFVFFGL